MKVAIVKYNAGNIYSVVNALRRLGVEPVVTDDPAVLRSADRVLFPGQGEASQAMGYLREHGLDEVIRSLRQPVLGICIGQQLMCRHSEEGDTDCLGIFPVDVLRFKPQRHEQKVPHMGWNEIRIEELRLKNEELRLKNDELRLKNEELRLKNDELRLKNDENTPQSSIINHQSSIINHQSSIINHQSSIINHQSYVYFVHSFYVPVCEFTTATCDYIVPFSAALHKDNFYATQFHPEKSGAEGEEILRRFLNLNDNVNVNDNQQ